MVLVTGFLISSMFIDIATLIIAKSGRFLKTLYSLYIFTPLRLLYSSDKIFFRGIKKMYKKLMKVSFFYRYSRLLVPPPEVPALKKDYSVFVIIPAYNEEENIGACIRSAFEQTKRPEKVIVIDDCSTDRTAEICMEAKKKYRDLVVIRQRENRGKAHNISYVINNFFLGDVTLVLDADTILSGNYIEEIAKPFDNERVMISTGISTPLESSNIFGKIIFRGSVFQYLFFCFRKEAQALRNAVSVICGDSSAYRTSFLKKLGGFPEGTVTEDMDLTWEALEMGHLISFQGKAFAKSRDPTTFKGHWKQMYRWYSGGFQCIYKHGRKLLKAKLLLFTSLLPTYFDILVYSPLFLLGPVLFFFFPTVIIWFYILDFLFTLLALLYVDWRMVTNIPEIYAIKFIWSSVWLFAALKTTFEYLGGKRVWRSRWNRDGLYAKSSGHGFVPTPTLNRHVSEKGI